MLIQKVQDIQNYFLLIPRLRWEPWNWRAWLFRLRKLLLECRKVGNWSLSVEWIALRKLTASFDAPLSFRWYPSSFSRDRFGPPLPILNILCCSMRDKFSSISGRSCCLIVALTSYSMESIVPWSTELDYQFGNWPFPSGFCSKIL
jgi:hypothetical protein